MLEPGLPIRDVYVVQRRYYTGEKMTLGLQSVDIAKNLYSPRETPYSTA